MASSCLSSVSLRMKDWSIFRRETSKRLKVARVRIADPEIVDGKTYAASPKAAQQRRDHARILDQQRLRELQLKRRRRQARGVEGVDDVGLDARLLKLYASVVCVGVWVLHLARGARARSPRILSTTLSDISIPAEIPAEVKTRPSWTKCLSYLTVIAGKESRIVSRKRQWVVAAGHPRALRSSAGASRCRRRLRFRLSGARAEPVMQRDVVHVVAETPAARNEDDVQCWTVGQ